MSWFRSEKKSVSASLHIMALDVLREEGETDSQIVARIIHSTAKPALLAKERAVEKAKVDLTAREAAEETVRTVEAALNAAEATADAAIAAKLGI